MILNPVKGDVSDSELNEGVVILTQPRKWMKERRKAPLKSIKVMITCKKSGPYLKSSLRYWDLKILR